MSAASPRRHRRIQPQGLCARPLLAGAKVDLIERLPTPIRPRSRLQHHLITAAETVSRLREDRRAAGFRFLGNVKISATSSTQS